MNFLQVKNQSTGGRRVIDPFSAVFHEMDRLFHDFNRQESPAQASVQYQWSPACDISEREGGYLVEVDLPGVKEQDITVEVKGKHLVIGANRNRNSNETRDSGYRCERLFGSFQRSFALPEDIDADKIEAQYRNGVLTVALPKRPHALARKIEIGQSQKEGGLLQKLFSRVEAKDPDTAH